MGNGRSCGRNGKSKRRDFRMISLDSPCDCGVSNGDYCLNLVSLWTPIKDLKPVVINETFAMYKVNPPEYTDDHWEAFMIGLKIRAFPRNDIDETKDKKNVNDTSWFAVKYGEIVLTSQVSI